MKRTTKWQAIKAILFAVNYMVYTDTITLGSVSPLHADRFIDQTNLENERLRLISVRHDRAMAELATQEFGVVDE